MTQPLSHLQQLEADSIHVLREVVAECRRPVLLTSLGKDSAVLLHLARKAFHPGPLPFPLLHVDTTWKFRAMYAMRATIAALPGVQLIVHRNPEAVARSINPFDHGPLHTDLWKTDGLKQALAEGGYDVAFGGARRDEDPSRAKERVLSFRTAAQQWDPRSQRPELWRLYNARISPGESLRAFPLSDWTELDVWHYIRQERIELVPLYFAAPRPVVERDGMLVMVDDDRMRLRPGEEPSERMVRFRTLGCYPLTGAVPSTATNLDQIIAEIAASRGAERQGRMIDREGSGSTGGMERRKREGYF